MANLDVAPMQAGDVLVTSDRSAAGLPVQAVSKLPPLKPGEDPLAIFYFGPIEILGDIVSPAEDWDCS